MTTQLMSLSEIRRAVQKESVSARAHVQVESVAAKTTREQQPYCELTLADACDRMTLRIWSDHPTYKTCSDFEGGEFDIGTKVDLALNADGHIPRSVDPGANNEPLPSARLRRARLLPHPQVVLDGAVLS